MKKFINITNDGNEKVIRKGITVPKGDIPLAYYSSPSLDPKSNLVIIDTSQTIAENSNQQLQSKKVMYANGLGILEDIYGNQLVSDEHPIVSDVFNIDEDYSTEPNISEYDNLSILPYLHTSRFFHLDFAGLTPGTLPRTYVVDTIKIVDGNGKDYTYEDGRRRYRIAIAPAAAAYQDSYPNHWGYRVLAYVDANDNENLYLTYNKIEIDNNQFFQNQELSYRELLNPQTYFQYQPEESAVVDPENREKKQYSTKPLAEKERLLGLPRPSVDGYKVYVPKKAIADTRKFQMFRWRAVCDYTKVYQYDQTNPKIINAGIVITSTGTLSDIAGKEALTPYVFYNLQRSNVNVNNIHFVNPLQENNTILSKKESKYWYVNLDTVTNEELDKFDILLWAPQGSVNVSRYIPKIAYFTSTKGKTFVFDSCNNSVPSNHWFFGSAVNAKTGAVTFPSPQYYRYPNTAVNQKARLDKAVWYPLNDPDTVRTGGNSITRGWSSHIRRRPVGTPNEVFSGRATLGGWDIDDLTGDNEIKSLSYGSYLYSSSYCQLILGLPNTYKSLVSYFDSAGQEYSLLAHKKLDNHGNIFLSSMGQAKSVNALWQYPANPQYLMSHNNASRINSDGRYDLWINSPIVEGASKLLYNICLMAVRGKLLHNSDDVTHASVWTAASDWQSSWVIDGNVLSDNERNEFNFVYAETDIVDDDRSLVWQRKLSNSNLRTLVEANLTDLQKRTLWGSIHSYRIETTNNVINNGSVDTPVTLDENSIPHAWTTAYSPTFTVPADMGPHIVKEHNVKGDLAGVDTYKQYPEAPYKTRVKVTAVQSHDDFVNWVATGTAKEKYLVSPEETITTTKIVEIPWDRNTYVAGTSNPYKNVSAPEGISFLQEYNYLQSAGRGAPSQNWVFWGLIERYGVNDYSVGDVVQFIQDAMNVFQFFGVFRLPNGIPLKVDGVFDQKTKAAVLAFQQSIGARYLDGVVDAETWSLIGGQISRLGSLIKVNVAAKPYQKYYQWAIDRMPKQNISDGSSDYLKSFAKRSWAHGGPSYIHETFFIKYSQAYNIVGIKFYPFVEQCPSVILESFDFHNGMTEAEKASYNPSRAWVKGPWVLGDNQLFQTLVNPVVSDTAIISLGQDKRGPNPNNVAKILGIRDFKILAAITGTTVHKAVWAERNVTITQTGTSQLINGSATTQVSLKADDRDLVPGTIRWQSIAPVPADPQITATITSRGSVRITLSGHDSNTAQYRYGPIIGAVSQNSATYYTMDTSKRRNPIRDSGFASADDGIKLVCNLDKTPYGFETITGSRDLLPSASTSDRNAVHFSMMQLNTYETDPRVRVGFYDLSKQEFIVSANGTAEMSWIDYLARGTNNVYIAILSTLSETTTKPIPDDDYPMIPFRWAMPAYGVASNRSSIIKLETINNELDEHNVWPISVKTGRFDRKIKIRPQSEGPIVTYMRDYQDSYVTAYYSIPEAISNNWSTIYGPPNIDIKEETPIVLNDRTIQVRQAPIYMQKEPTSWNYPSDPVRPIFTVFTRDSLSAAWVTLLLTDIEDYNVSTGEIKLKTALLGTDPRLVKVDYTSAHGSYYFKGVDSIMNLNPYHGYTSSYFGKAIYVYLLPEFVVDQLGDTIVDSVRQRCIKTTDSPDIFNPLSLDYDPLAIQIGVIYIIPSVDINDLTMVDARRRGGGILDEYTLAEIGRLFGEATTNWDVSTAAGVSYQKAGFVIIRLPVQLKNWMKESEIRDVIDRNITSGVWYDIEDLDGNPWSDA